MGQTLPFTCEKQPASGRLGVVVSNAPLGSAAGAQMLLAGGNAVDAAVATLLALTVVEPMMVGIAGGGIAQLRLADGRHVIVDALSIAGRGARADMFEPLPGQPPGGTEAVDRRNRLGASAVAVPGNLRGWFWMHRQYGRLPWADVVEPAISAAVRGFAVSPYLHGAIAENAPDLQGDPVMAAMMLPGGAPLPIGHRLVMPSYAESLRLIAAEGDTALHGGALGAALIARLAEGGERVAGHVTMDDLTGYRAVERAVITGDYRGYTIAGPPPPASSGVHVVQMLNLLEPHDLRGMGFGSPATMDLLAAAMRVAFTDRRAASGDPDFVDVPVARYMSKDYARDSQHRLNRRDPGGRGGDEGPHTTHVTVADRDGLIVSATHTINALFGAGFVVPGTGIIPNNYMLNYDPHPGRAMSVAPGKRVPTSMAPMIVLRDGSPLYALGLPGGSRIFPSAMQAIVNLIDHRMTLQQAIEAPRLWTEGQNLFVEPGYASMAEPLRAMGHTVEMARTLGGGMNAIAFAGDGVMQGAACWRADGHVVAIGGGMARPGARFVI